MYLFIIETQKQYIWSVLESNQTAIHQIHLMLKGASRRHFLVHKSGIVTESLKKNQLAAHLSQRRSDLVLFHLVPRGGVSECTTMLQSTAISCLFCMFGTLTSIVVRLHRWVPANQPSEEHWSISTSCRFMSTRTTPLQNRRACLSWRIKN